MSYQSTPYTVAFFAAAAVLGGLTGYLSIRFRDDIDDPLVLLLVAITAIGGFWSTTVGFQIASTSLAAKVAWARASFVGVLLPPIWVLFALVYTRRTDLVTPWTTAALFSIPAVTTALILGFGPGRTIWATYRVVDNGAFLVLRSTAQGWYVPVIVYLYVLVLVGIAVLYRWLYRSSDVYRDQAIALTVGAIAPTAVNALFFLGIGLPHPNVDVTPIGFAISGVAFTYAVVRRRLLDVVPVARRSAIESMRDAYFVLDGEKTVVDTNPAAHDIAAVGDPVGATFESVLPECPDVGEMTDGPVTVEIERGDDRRWFDARASTVGDGSGTLLVLREVTERERREAELRETNERLETFARTVSHDLRNPLSVAQGYAELAREDPSPETVAEIETSLERMDAIIDDVLTLARGEGEVEATERVDLSTLARRAWETVDTDDATLEIDGDRTLSADPDRCRRAFENLVRNAVEHGSTSPRSDAPEDAVEHGGSVVTVEVGTLPEGFYVADDGPGFPDDVDGDLTAPGETTAADGTGLGLAIVSEIADAHGWTVTLGESDAGGARIAVRGVETP